MRRLAEITRWATPSIVPRQSGGGSIGWVGDQAGANRDRDGGTATGTLSHYGGTGRGNCFGRLRT